MGKTGNRERKYRKNCPHIPLMRGVRGTMCKIACCAEFTPLGNVCGLGAA